MLSVENLEAVYHDVILAVNSVSLRVPDGARVAILGVNGAGKTTMMRCITGLLESTKLKVTKGRIDLDGESLLGRDPAETVGMGICLVPEGRMVFKDLTVEENLRLGAYTRRDHEIRADLDRVLAYFPILQRRLGDLAGYLSGGEQQMLAIGRALMARPKVMMLDEPSLGLAPRVVEEIFEILLRINREQHAAVLLVEQNARLALGFAEYGYVMESGRIVLDGSTDVLKRNDDVREFYLGVGETGAKNYREVKAYKKRKRWLS